MACEFCQLDIFTFGAICANEESLFQFLLSHGVISTSRICPQCQSQFSFDNQSKIFSCRRYRRIKNRNKKSVKIRCEIKQSMYNNTWFSQSKLSVEMISKLTCLWILLKPPRQEFCIQSLKITSNTVVDWFSYCRLVCLDWCSQNSTILGGPNVIVEIDEAKIGKRKYNRGRWIDGYWIFGAFERDTGRAFVVQVPDRTASTLINIIKEWILPGTTIISDRWRSYRELDNHGFDHMTVNHSVNFVDPDTGAHTNNIERLWRDVRSTIPRYGTRKAHSAGYLAEFLFKRKYPDVSERLHHFFKAIGETFPPN